MADVDYKSLLSQAKAFVTAKYDYSKLTIAEKLSVLLAYMVISAIALLIGFSVLLFLSGALVNILFELTGSEVLSYVIVAGVWLVILLLVLAFKTALIINPVTRFVTKLMFNPNNDDNNNK